MNCFDWTMLNKEIVWNEVEKSVDFILREKIAVIDDNELFSEISRLKLYCTASKIKEWENKKVETDQKWMDIFRHFKNKHIAFKNLQMIAEIVMCLPGTNASVERVFSLSNDFWSSEKASLSVEGLAAVLKVKCNMECSCQEIGELLESNSELCKAIHSKSKYNP